MKNHSRKQMIKQAFKYQDALTAYSYAMIKDWALAEDIVQDSLIVVIEKWESFKPGTSLYGWIRAIVYNKTMEYIRKTAHEQSTEEEQLQELIHEAMDLTLDETYAESMQVKRMLLQDCLAQLSGSAVDLLRGFYKEMKSYKALAILHNRNIEAVKKMLYRSRQKLTECVQKQLSSDTRLKEISNE